MNQNLSYLNQFHNEQLYDHFKNLIEFHCQNHGMKFPISFNFDDPEYKLFFNHIFKINSTLDIEMIALLLSKFPYGNQNKYTIGSFHQESDLIRICARRYKKSEEYESLKDFYERNPEACFDKVSSIPVWNFLDEDLRLPITNKREIFTKNELIGFYGYSSPMNFLEHEFNQLIWEAYNSLSSFSDFEDYVDDKKLFLRSYFNKLLRNRNADEINLISLNEFIFYELASGYY